MNPDLQDWMYSLQEATKAGDKAEVQRALAHIKSLNSAANQADFREAETPELNTGVANAVAGIGDAVIEPVQALVDRGIESAQQPAAGYSPPWARQLPGGDARALLAGARKVPGAILRGGVDLVKAPFQAKTGREFMKAATNLGLAVEGTRVPIKALARKVPAVGRAGNVAADWARQAMPFKGRIAAVVDAGRSPIGRVRAEIVAEAKRLGTQLKATEVDALAEARLAQREAAFTAPLRPAPAPPSGILGDVKPAQGAFPAIEGTGAGETTLGMSAGEARALNAPRAHAREMVAPDRLQKIRPTGLLGSPPPEGILAPREIGSPYSGVLGRTSGPSPSPEVMASFGEELAARDAAKAAARAEDFAHVSGPGMGRSPAGHKIVPPADAMEQSAAYYRALEQRPITPMPIRETPVTPLRPDSPLEKIAKRAKAETETAERVQAGVTKAHLAADQSRMVERFKGYTDEQLRGVMNKSGFDSAKEAAKAELASRAGRSAGGFL